MKNNLQLSDKAKYEWNPGFKFPVSHTDIKLVLKELQALEKEYGEITPARLVESSRDTKSVLHSYFEWNNTKAADAWRMRQAGFLLSNIEIKIVKDGKPIRMQAYQVNRIPFSKSSETTYTKFNALTKENHSYIRQRAVGGLVAIKNKLEANDYDEIIPYLEKAIQLLQKREPISIKSKK
jgi:hypothetical protein